MKQFFFNKVFLLLLFILWAGMGFTSAQKQDFETDFQAVDFPAAFLPNWYGNDVNASSSRIFQISGQGRGGSKALAVQPISTFDGRIWIRLDKRAFRNPEVIFFAKSMRNGTGTRPARVFYSWSQNLEGDYSIPAQLGDDLEFPNENQEFRKFSLSLPEDLGLAGEIYLRLDIRYGAGSGSAARWIMDDFEFGDIVRDVVSPTIEEVKGYSENELWVRFSEPLDEVFSAFPIAYQLDGINPEKAVLMQDSVVVLTFYEVLEQSREYSLQVGQIPDLEGNFLQDTLIRFAFSDPTAIRWKDLVINELMPAPRADQDLPNAEYIELFHAGDQEFRLEGVMLSNSRSVTRLDEFWMQPGSFVILVPENQSALFSGLGPVLPVKGWPTQLNSGDQNTIRSRSGTEIDRLAYSTANWGGAEFAGGGYSLEVPNPYFLCDNSSVLRSSIDPSRGTPGSHNSVYDFDLNFVQPVLKSVFFIDSLRIRVVFSGPILPNLNTENFTFTPALAIDKLDIPREGEVVVFLQNPAIFNQSYELELNSIKDCFGNSLDLGPVNLVLPEIPKPGELIINELLFDPKTGDPKFVELRNVSSKYLDYEGWALSNLNSNGEVDQIRIFGGPGNVMPPQSYLAVTTNSSSLRLAYPKSSQGNFIQISSLPSYPIAGGTVVLVSPDGKIVELFRYDEDLHHPLLRNPKGVSLERISPTSPASHRMNWQSASGSEEFATPGRRNSQTREGELTDQLIEIDPEVFDPEGSSGPASTSIRYQLDQPGWMGTFRIYSAAGQLIHTLAQNQILGTDGLLTWTGTDSTGKLVRPGYYVLVVEIYEPGGETRVIKKTLVVATRL